MSSKSAKIFSLYFVNYKSKCVFPSPRAIVAEVYTSWIVLLESMWCLALQVMVTVVLKPACLAFTHVSAIS